MLFIDAQTGKSMRSYGDSDMGDGTDASPPRSGEPETLDLVGTPKNESDDSSSSPAPEQETIAPGVQREEETIAPAGPSSPADDATIIPGAVPGPDSATLPAGGAKPGWGFEQLRRQPALPDRIGHYRIERVIASGGMGTVYEAVQDQPRRTVALKVIKAGLASRAALRRFEYEAEVLARLRHPGIAQVYEAGTHDDGSGGEPFFAMEFIPDARILTDYAETRRLTTRDRLEMFIEICDAVHHGHQKGVIHRDLKPANILVDAQGQPKIIDFGIARATDSDMAGGTLQTQVGDLVGTVQYMSPEQCEADPNDLDTRSDVYALGIVLYELLTGSLPYDVSNVAIFEATRIIRERMPTPLAPINSELKGDIETITFKALEKERERRYQSALELENDIRRYLNDEPILARPPSVAYQLSRFAKRNKPVVAGIAGVVAALIFAFVGITYFLIQARREATTANAIVGYFQDMFNKLDPRGGDGPRNARVADLLDDVAKDVQLRLNDEPEVQAALRWSVGNGYRALTMYDKAETQLRAALALQRQTMGKSAPEIAQTLEDLSAVLYFTGSLAESESLQREALEIRRKIFGNQHEEVASSLNYLAAVLDRQGRHEEAETYFRQALDMRQRLLADHEQDDDARKEMREMVARSMNNLATCLRNEERYREAEQLHRESVIIVQELHGPDHIDVARGLSNIARCLVARNRLHEAEPLLRQSLDIKLKKLLPDDASVALSNYYLADLLHRLGRDDEAEPFAREALEVTRERFTPPHFRIIECTALQAEILSAMGDESAAEQAWRDLVELRRLASPAGSKDLAAARGHLGDCLARQGRYEEAEPLLLESYQALEEDPAATAEVRDDALDRMIAFYESWDRPETAQRYRERLTGAGVGSER